MDFVSLGSSPALTLPELWLVPGPNSLETPHTSEHHLCAKGPEKGCLSPPQRRDAHGKTAGGGGRFVGWEQSQSRNKAGEQRGSGKSGELEHGLCFENASVSFGT